MTNVYGFVEGLEYDPARDENRKLVERDTRWAVEFAREVLGAGASGEAVATLAAGLVIGKATTRSGSEPEGDDE